MLVVAHGNSLRALVKHLQGISDDDIPQLNIPTGVPLLYELDDDFRPLDDRPVDERYLADADAVRATADAVARSRPRAADASTVATRASAGQAGSTADRTDQPACTAVASAG